MSFLIEDRVMETSVTTGAGTLTLAGAVTGYRTFGDAIGSSNTCPYLIVAVDANGQPTGAWETGIGTVGSGTLARTTVIRSINGNAAVSFAAGTKRVAVAMSEHFVKSRVIPRNVVVCSSNTSLSADDSGKLYVATANVQFTIPTLAEDLIFRFLQETNNAMTIAGGASNIIGKNTITGSTITYSTASEKIGAFCMIEAVNISGTLKWVFNQLSTNTVVIS